MSRMLRFAMGEYEAQFPADLHYARNHMWAEQREQKWRFGFSMYAVRLLQDVYFLEWNLDPSTAVKERQEIGFIESKKAESDLFSPITGTLTEFNQELLADPSSINVDNYGSGWLFEIEGSGSELMTAEAYLEHLAAVWEVTQRTIKGQMNE
jgi:glycine cleavage system H protein